MPKVAEGAPGAAAEVVAAELQQVAVAVREAQPDRQAAERRVGDSVPVRKVGLERKAAALVRKADSITALGRAVRRDKVARAPKETKTQNPACKMASRAAETLAHVIRIPRVRSATRLPVAALGRTLVRVFPPATLAMVLTAIHRADKQQVAIRLVPVSSDSQTM
jgi:hypothetical protein